MLQVTPSSRHSTATCRVRPHIAALLTTYGKSPGIGRIARVEPMLMIVPWLAAQERQRGLDAQPGPLDVHVLRQVPHLFIGRFDGPARADAGVVHEHVEPSPAGLNGVDGVRPVAGLGHVQADAEGLEASINQVRGRQEHQICAPRRPVRPRNRPPQNPGDSLADSLCGPVTSATRFAAVSVMITSALVDRIEHGSNGRLARPQ